MNKAQRLAAGWTECWGVFDYRDDTWLDVNDEWSSFPARRFDYGSHEAASKQATGGGFSARRFWRRTKSLALKVGDKVVVRGVVENVDGSADVRMRLGSGRVIWIHQADVTKSTARNA